MEDDGTINIDGDAANKYKDAFISSVTESAEKTWLSVDFTKIDVKEMKKPAFSLIAGKGGNINLIKCVKGNYYVNGYYDWTDNISAKLSEVSTMVDKNTGSVPEGTVGIALCESNKMTISVYDAVAMPVVDHTKYENLSFGKENTIKAKLTLPNSKQTFKYANIVIQQQGGSWGNIGKSTTTYNAESGQLETTLSLTDDEINTLKSALAENENAYKLTIQIVLNLSDGATEYQILGDRCTFTIND